MKYKIVGADGDFFVLSPQGEFEMPIWSQKVKIDGEWRLKARKGNFVRMD